MNTVDGPGSSDGSGAGTDAAVPPGWTMLISRTWSLPSSGSEAFECVRIKVDQDYWISGFKPLAPPGTHHSLLTLDPVTTQTGNFDCDGSTGFDPIAARLLYASGENTNELTFPPGIAVHIPANAYITLNLHLLDSSDFGMHDTSGVLVQTVDQAQVTHEIDATFAGTESIDIKADGQNHAIVGGCSAPSAWHVFAAWPHMHENGVYTRASSTDANNVSRMLVDAPFDFTNEKIYSMNETVLNQGDLINVQCTYNAGTHTCSYPNGACLEGSCQSDGYCHVPYGESANGEMCFTALYKYPAGDVPVYGCHH
jgi:hypothetical protein